MPDIEETIVRQHLQAAHDRGGGWQMAMRMMARRILKLEDWMIREGLDPSNEYGERNRTGTGTAEIHSHSTPTSRSGLVHGTEKV